MYIYIYKGIYRVYIYSLCRVYIQSRTMSKLYIYTLYICTIYPLYIVRDCMCMRTHI